MANTIDWSKYTKEADRRLQIDLMMPSIAELALLTEKERQLLLERLAEKIATLSPELHPK